MSMSDYIRNKVQTREKIQEKGFYLDAPDCDDLFNQAMRQVRMFGLNPEHFDYDGLSIDLRVTGPALRTFGRWIDDDGTQWQGYLPLPQDEGESRLSAWLPTISCSIVGSNEPFLKAKFKDSIGAGRAYQNLVDHIKSSCVHSPGDLYRAIQDVTHYPHDATVEIIVGRTPAEMRELDLLTKEVNKRATKILREMRKNLDMDQVVEIYDRLGSRLDFILNRTRNLLANGSPRAMLARSRIKTLTGYDYAQWLALADKTLAISSHEISDGAEDLIIGQDDPVMPILEDDE